MAPEGFAGRKNSKMVDRDEQMLFYSTLIWLYLIFCFFLAKRAGCYAAQ